MAAKRLKSKRAIVVAAVLLALLIGGGCVFVLTQVGKAQQLKLSEQTTVEAASDLAIPVDPGAEPASATMLALETSDSPVTDSESIQMPLILTEQFGQQQSENKGSTVVWRANTTADCEQAATDVLKALQAQGWQLKESGYLDLFGNAWGCVAVKGTVPDQRVLTISLLPQGEELSLRIVEILAP